RVVTAGLSAGAQIASLLALSDENEETPVVGFLHFFGPSDFIQMSRYTKDPEAPLNRSSSNVFLLFGGPLLENLPRAAEASPVTYLDESDPPSLIFVGDHDSLMNQRQCRRLYEASQEKGLESQLHIIPGAGHGGPEFSDATRKNLILTFLQSLQQ
ncbi:MAG: alpha/beta hydrolase, partial [Verrucomicrobiota bacterium]